MVNLCASIAQKHPHSSETLPSHQSTVIILKKRRTNKVAPSTLRGSWLKILEQTLHSEYERIGSPNIRVSWRVRFKCLSQIFGYNINGLIRDTTALMVRVQLSTVNFHKLCKYTTERCLYFSANSYYPSSSFLLYFLSILKTLHILDSTFWIPCSNLTAFPISPFIFFLLLPLFLFCLSVPLYTFFIFSSILLLPLHFIHHFCFHFHIFLQFHFTKPHSIIPSTLSPFSNTSFFFPHFSFILLKPTYFLPNSLTFAR